jgi:hypothetical protein
MALGRWTARQSAEVIKSVVEDKVSPRILARIHGVSVAEIGNLLNHFSTHRL